MEEALTAEELALFKESGEREHCLSLVTISSLMGRRLYFKESSAERAPPSPSQLSSLLCWWLMMMCTISQSSTTWSCTSSATTSSSTGWSWQAVRCSIDDGLIHGLTDCPTDTFRSTPAVPPSIRPILAIRNIGTVNMLSLLVIVVRPIKHSGRCGTVFILSTSPSNIDDQSIKQSYPTLSNNTKWSNLIDDRPSSPLSLLICHCCHASSSFQHTYPALCVLSMISLLFHC